VGFWDGSDISWTIMQAICTSLQTDSHTNTSSLEFLQAGCSSWRPTNSVKALKACIIMQVKCFTARVPTALSDLALYMAPRLLRAFRSYSDFSRFFCLALDHCNKTLSEFFFAKLSCIIRNRPICVCDLRLQIFVLCLLSACKKTEWWGAGEVICLERGADLHVAQLMPLPLTVCCFS